MKWHLLNQPSLTWALSPAPAGTAALVLTVRARQASQRFVEITFRGVGTVGERRAVFAVEWPGGQDLYVTRSLLGLDTGAPWPAFTELILAAGEAAMPEEELEIEPPIWVQAVPPFAVNANERLLVNFMHGSYFDPTEWVRTTACTLPPSDGGLTRNWLYGILEYIEQPGRTHVIAVRKTFDLSLGNVEALVLAAAVDRRGCLSMHAEIDGANVALLDRHVGGNVGEELRLPVTGKRLNALTLRLDTNPEFAGQSPGQHVCTQLRWLMIERRGAPMAAGAEVTGVPAIAVSPAAPAKPPTLPLRLAFDPSELQPLQSRIATGIGQRLFAAIRRRADETLHDEPERFVGTYLPINWGNQGIERTISPSIQAGRWFGSMLHGGLVFALTSEREFGDAARRALLCAIRCRHWAAGFPARIPAGFASYRAPFIEAHTSEAVALTYDWVYDLLSNDERDEVEDALFWKGATWLDAYLRRHGEGYLLRSNQGAVYFCGLTFACLGARRRHPQAEALLDRHLPWFRRMLAAYYNPDGTTNEGLLYWQYTTCYVAIALHLLARHRGLAPREFAPPYFPKTLDYLLHMRSLASAELGFLNIGDCHNGASFDFMSSTFLYLARTFDLDAARWLWQRFLSRPRPANAAFYGWASGQFSSAPAFELLWADEEPAAPPELPAIHRFQSAASDRIFVRTGADTGDWLLFIEAGPQTFEHSHFDKGAFILEAFGDALVCDAGMIDYSDPNHAHLSNTAFHNLITIAGGNQSYRDAARAAQVLAVETDSGVTRIRLDLTSAYKEFNRYRRTLWCRPGAYVLIIDDVDSQKTGLEWRLHSQGVYRRTTETADTAEQIRLAATAKNAAMDVWLTAASPIQFVTRELTTSQGRLCGQLLVTPAPEARCLRLAALLVPRHAADAAPLVRFAVDWQNANTPWVVTGPWGSDRDECSRSLNSKV